MRGLLGVVFISLSATSALAAAPTFDLNKVIIVGSPDVRGFAQTSKITEIKFENGRFRIDHAKRGQWPGVDIGGGTLQEATVWVFFNLGGKWYGTGGERLRPGQNEKELLGGAADIGPGWLYDPNRWGPMTNHRIQPGETVGFMVVAGSTRSDNQTPVKERTNVVLVTFNGDPGAGGSGGGGGTQPATGNGGGSGGTGAPPTPGFGGGSTAPGPNGGTIRIPPAGANAILLYPEVGYYVGDDPALCPKPDPSHPYRHLLHGFDLSRMESAANTPKYAFAKLAQDLPPTDACIRKIAETLGKKMGCLDIQDNFMLDTTRDGYIGYRTWNPDHAHWKWFGYNEEHPDPGAAGPAGMSPNCAP